MNHYNVSGSTKPKTDSSCAVKESPVVKPLACLSQCADFSASIQMFTFLSWFSSPSPISDSHICLLSVCPWFLLSAFLSKVYATVIFWFLGIIPVVWSTCCIFLLQHYFFLQLYIWLVCTTKKCFSFTLPMDFPLKVFTSGKGQIMLSSCKILIILINASSGLNSVLFLIEDHWVGVP